MAVHPRACGEHVIDEVSLYAGLRFIPAPAGNTAGSRSAAAPIPVHPRACGEHGCSLDDPKSVTGSSPRLRGTRLRRDRAHHRLRFIPAPAGNTPGQAFGRRARPVHPRACGEHPAEVVVMIDSVGSSPRLRGTRVRVIGDVVSDRFIPAPAGNTSSGATQILRRSVHPRACGEHSIPASTTWAAIGSSPRLRGTRASRRSSGPGARFIPAPAGNTRHQARNKSQMSVHPRACGEHSDSRLPISPTLGSSPRLRGTR